MLIEKNTCNLNPFFGTEDDKMRRNWKLIQFFESELICDIIEFVLEIARICFSVFGFR